VPAPASGSSGAARRFDVGAALGVDFSSDGAVPLGAVGARWLPARWGLGAGLSAVISGARNVELSNGSVRYLRWPVLLGPALRLPLGSAALDVHAGATLAWLRVEGIDFDGENRHDDFAAGGFVALRLALGSGALRPFAELSGALWAPAEAFVHHGDTELSIDLPQLQFYAVFGAAWQVP
jgi:hypothetical protein